MKWKLNPKGVHVRSGSKGRISCAVKSNAKNLRGLGKERRLIFLWLVLFSRRGTGYEILTSSAYVFTTESQLPLAGHAPHVFCFVPKVISKHRTKPNQRPKAERGMSKRMSQHILQETGILCAYRLRNDWLLLDRINIRVRIWVLQWEGRKKKNPPRTPVKSFINFLVLTVSKKVVVAAI